jgi:Transcription factor WhiB
LVAVERRDLLAGLMRGDEYPEAADVLAFVRPRWMSRAACRGSELTFVPNAASVEPAAVELCRTCSVRTECATLALSDPGTYGCWGGSSEKLRRRARAQGWSVAELIARADQATATQ